jgi:CubicO group peptidase (beta-lactamase class C family)
MDRTRVLLAAAHAEGAFPAAALEVGRRAGPLWRDAVGRLTFAPDAPACQLTTIFDLASLTKVIATASVAMKLIGDGLLDLTAPIGPLIDEWQGADRNAVTPRHLLDHSSGLPAHVRLWEAASDREAFQAAISRLPLERPVGRASVYSDVGFMLLGFVLEAAGRSPLDVLFEPLAAHGDDVLCYRPPASLESRIAPTESSARPGGSLSHAVHDENAAAPGGVAAHAGLFGTVTAVGRFARLVLETFQVPTRLGTPTLMRDFARKSALAGSSRALAWDTMLPTSSCGSRLSPTAIGHTGFTGTSLWIDRERDLYVVLLTNRVHPTRDNERLVELRPRLHDTVVEALEGGEL